MYRILQVSLRMQVLNSKLFVAGYPLYVAEEACGFESSDAHQDSLPHPTLGIVVYTATQSSKKSGPKRAQT